MPKGFLVKRNKRPTPVSYRVRSSEEDERDEARLLLLTTASYYQQRPAPPPASLLLLSSGGAAPPLPSSASPERATTAAAPCPASGARLQQQPTPPPEAPQRPTPLFQFGHPECGYHPSALYSPSRPVSRDQRPPESSFSPGSSPACGESFPGGAPVASKRSPQPEPKHPPPAPQKPPKKTKAIRKLTFEDEVTTSPVLGLRIKEGPPDPPRARPPGATARPLGEFICQLCREEYADPLALAQHRCSRIVRVEYRCPECDKVFSCPANLASHRRWHKPRPPPAQPAGPAGEVKAEAGEPRTDTPSPGPSESGSDEGLYECPHCSKRFRRQAYLRKHLLAHQASQSPAAEEAPACGPLDMSSRPYPCPVCGEAFPSQSGQERHLRLLHATQLYPCKYCPATFYSSPGLTRHINKCHPSENRQVILLQVPVRPAC
ncbi:insulinoma-associated protein 1 [Pleurodeles waltl]|uniref:insulinoma-associated protein 1 n=1 Tax=Pleurodeles waltl TaxID=8319 RepID=UPI0037096B94